MIKKQTENATAAPPDEAALDEFARLLGRLLALRSRSDGTPERDGPPESRGRESREPK